MRHFPASPIFSYYVYVQITLTLRLEGVTEENTWLSDCFCSFIFLLDRKGIDLDMKNRPLLTFEIFEN